MIIRTAFGKSIDEWHDKKFYQGGADVRLGAGSNKISTLHIDVHHHIRAGGDVIHHFRLESAVHVFVYFSIFDKLIVGDALFKILTAEEMVIVAVFFTFARGASGAGDGVDCLTFISEPAAERCFPRAGRSGN